MKDVARRAGVSVATVSHVINGSKAVSEKNASRVRRAAEDGLDRLGAPLVRLRHLVHGAIIADRTGRRDEGRRRALAEARG